MLVAEDVETAESAADDVDADVESVALESLVEIGMELSEPFAADSPVVAVPTSVSSGAFCGIATAFSAPPAAKAVSDGAVCGTGSVLLGAALMSLMLLSVGAAGCRGRSGRWVWQ
ncbi:hypothetical protein [Burkholderia thailandensis]|uniref:hypothetical protein n=1 Tax=Burkholderia thailandensis TaxID=57975 RepID=UPI000AAA027B|nr:hypothetical protein [Burkholderia thailandensis]MCS6498105.1 hypothetical protein [Burkholderia thailandensis]NBJ22626.1 hypothetical protein [Burkholderia thailandensis]